MTPHDRTRSGRQGHAPTRVHAFVDSLACCLRTAFTHTLVIAPATLLATLLGSAPALAQTAWPGATTKVVLGSSPGTATDLAARIVCDALARETGTAVVTDNRPGADGYIAADQVAHAAPDGQTLFFASQSIFGIDPHLRKNLPVDPERDFTPIAVLVDDTGPTGIFVHPSLPFTSLAGMSAWGRANPGRLSVATIVPLFSVVSAWVGKRTGTDILEVKYKSAPQAVQDVLAGRVTLYLDAWASMEQNVKAGRLRALAVSEPLDDQPQVQTLPSLYPGYRQPSFMVLAGPPGMSAALVERINRVAASVVENPRFNQDLARLRWRNTGGARTPQGTAEHMRRARADWGTYIREAGVVPE